MIIPTKPLFNNISIYDFLAKKRLKLNAEIQEIDEKSLLNTEIEILKTQITNIHLLKLPEVNLKKTTKKLHEEIRDISPYVKDGITLPDRQQVLISEFFTSFIGDSELFNVRPKKIPPSAAYGKISNNTIKTEVMVIRSSSSASADNIQKCLFENINKIKEHLEYLREDISSYNSSLSIEITTLVTKRINSIRDRDALGSDLGFPDRK